ncbi:hypothetical protein K7I13_07195 [Brucepastera parasyntrophica]|uniref:hypothetical protein n=1 Tax=Brucepastera parasyntrophica TaxID=2880008 RepID=UPI00210B0561|nr:hypothetical protein [Brucepastera parasyntrophica]ULQ61030.1 hypothetical protein K7I13_07195 [Brucepastera parasyntrophica]
MDIKEEYSFKYNYMQDLNKELYQNILNILSRFAKGDRYSNIDLIVNSRTYDDPINMWYKDVDMYLYNNSVSERKKETIENNARLIDMMTSSFTVVRHTAEDGSDINTVLDGSMRTGINDAVAPYRQLYVFRIMRFFIESLKKLQNKIMHENLFDIPYFSEIFAVFNNDDQYMKTRKTLEPM